MTENNILKTFHSLSKFPLSILSQANSTLIQGIVSMYENNAVSAAVS